MSLLWSDIVQILETTPDFELPPPDGQDELPGSVGTGQITNALEEVGDEGEPSYKPLPMQDIIARIRQLTGDWPRRVRGSLFTHDPASSLNWIDSPSSLFAWLQLTRGVVPWRRGVGFATKDELFESLKRAATSYDAIETLPHEPLVPGVFYAYQIPEPGDGTTLDGLIDRFSPKTDVDRDLIKAFAMTVVWGGAGGTRPAFVFTSEHGRGSGKSKVAEMFSRFLGGTMRFSSEERIREIKERLLTPDALAKRLCMLDNVKTLRFSWAELEDLITADRVSGRRMYVGEFDRPNRLTWAITLNGASLSTDMAQRAVIVMLAKPSYSENWEAETAAYIDSKREMLIADLIAALRADRSPLDPARIGRWGLWERDVLSRLTEPREAQATIRERQQSADVEAEEADLIENFVEDRLRDCAYATDTSRVFVPVAIMAEWYNQATGERNTVTAVSRKLKQKIEEGAIKRVVRSAGKAHGRGFIWVGDFADVNDHLISDLPTRLRREF